LKICLLVSVQHNAHKRTRSTASHRTTAVSPHRAYTEVM